MVPRRNNERHKKRVSNVLLLPFSRKSGGRGKMKPGPRSFLAQERGQGRGQGI